MVAYLGASIDLSVSDPTHNFSRLSSIIVDVLADGVVAFNPLTAFVNAAKSQHGPNQNKVCKFLYDVNMHAMRNSDIGLFIVSDSPSFGVPVEIFTFSTVLEKPFLVLSVGKKPGAYLKNVVLQSKYGYLTNSESYFIKLLQFFYTYITKPNFAICDEIGQYGKVLLVDN